MGGTIRLFKFSGIQVYLHFSWFLIAAYEFSQRKGVYASPVWAAAEIIALFSIVLLHEFGHALACRQTGGVANQIVLWPLGGIAFVSPPRRPGAMLWSIAAGPLVNVILLPILSIALTLSRINTDAPSDLGLFLYHVWWINLGLLIFNILPVYPLDGGQILRSLLWFPLGEIRSLQIASGIGLVGSVALAGLMLLLGTPIFWTAIMSLFLISRAVAGWQYAKALIQEEEANRAARLVSTVPQPDRPSP
ncbi:MAG TPA: site-2 protease family protein [Chthoniobacterales bacterium]|jgi:Zn-dependent protease|nr:site-2 protease family protein [Chthoniobacterales bacterium]